jgi:hypothetical protein
LSGTRFELSPSWILAAVIAGLHAAAAGALAAALPGMPGAALAAGLFALGLAAAWSRALLGARASPHALELAELQGFVELRSGERLAAAVRAPRHVSRFLVALALPRRTILVSRDMLGAESFRNLRLWALWGRLPRRAVAATQLRG